jgi:DnaK suppressor protein
MSEALDLRAIEAALRARKADLDERLAAFSRPPERGALLGFGKRIGDGTSEAVSRIRDAGVGERLETSADRISRALAKLDDGTYGICDSCGQPIAPARLKAVPESVLCIECAAR